ncbi:hypothetical protein TNIN_35301 [Trichonephila inaurata madagascariensis]|uniref:Uncharacterized protein n=1 Tax=Trichonephila inaurata madagascariensis TaxID=2747483 RepID=A0A8X7CFS8_9ARAC|nr:hypothetical protein TNIN_237441 [Trichonephila inaurata madagascariensis]GFY48834.1 hypothetical protein TNIN_180061 [Trichonephila inaurata madagascariensis]GFY63322.1 hypothetical protein TNIN_35301 [Trichonephila inaurata madagascariensis]
MDIIENGDLVFLYELVEGTATSSLASFTALRAGLSKKIVERNLQIVQAFKSSELVLPEESSWVHDKMKRYLMIFEKFAVLDVETDDPLEFLSFVKAVVEE